MTLLGGKAIDGSDGIQDVTMVNIGTEEAPIWAAVFTGLDGSGDPVSLADIKALIGALTSPGEGSVNKQLSTLIEGVSVTDFPALSSTTDSIQSKNGTTTTEIIDNATITQTVTSPDIDFTEHTNFMITYNLGAGSGGSPTLTITVLVKDSNGNYITDSDYTSAALTASATGMIKGYFEAAGTYRVVCTLGGTGTFAASTVDFIAKTA